MIHPNEHITVSVKVRVRVRVRVKVRVRVGVEGLRWGLGLGSKLG
jgi:hypothetical protein